VKIRKLLHSNLKRIVKRQNVEHWPFNVQLDLFIAEFQSQTYKKDVLTIRVKFLTFDRINHDAIMDKHKVQQYFIGSLGVILLVFIVGLQSFTKHKKTQTGGAHMELFSKGFKQEEFIPDKYSCRGQDINPELHWENIPEGTRSFALSVKDPDAPIGTFVHWLVYDIDKDTRNIPEKTVPGKQVKNNFGKEAYGGPCPPSGIHRYYFRLHALDVESLGSINTMDQFDEKVEDHTIEKAELMGKFEKK